MVSFYNPKEHSLVDGEIGPYVQRLDGKLFVVRYNDLGVFCICRWLAKPRDIFVDVLNLGKSLANFTRDKAEELKYRTFKPLTCRETSEVLASTESDYHHMRQEMNDA